MSLVNSDTLRKLSSLRLNQEQMNGVLGLLADIQQKEEDRLQSQRERKRRNRAVSQDSHETVTGQERDEDGDKDVKKQKEKRTKKEKIKNNNINIIIPPYIPPELWQDFEEHRDKLRKPMTARAKQEILGKLEKFRLQGYSPPELLKSAIEHGWLTIYEPRKENGHNGNQRNSGKKYTADDALREVIDEIRADSPPGPAEFWDSGHIRQIAGGTEIFDAGDD